MCGVRCLAFQLNYELLENQKNTVFAIYFKIFLRLQHNKYLNVPRNELKDDRVCGLLIRLHQLRLQRH